jgi:hypothetical protein
MPKSTHEHQKEIIAEFKPDDEKIFDQEKQEFQESEKGKRTEEEELNERMKAASKKKEE